MFCRRRKVFLGRAQERKELVRVLLLLLLLLLLLRHSNQVLSILHEVQRETRHQLLEGVLQEP